VISPEWIRQAREETRQRFGSALAEKATDDFCVTYAIGRRRSTSGMAIRLREEGVPASVLREGLGEPTREFQEFQEAVIELRPVSVGDGASERELARDLTPGDVVLEAVQGLEEAHLRLTERALATAARKSAIQDRRDSFYRERGSIRDEVERGSAVLGAATEARPRLGIAAAPVQACWLNGTIRASTHLSLLGDIAGHAAVETVDLPRPIVREASSITIEAARQLRERNDLSGAGVLVGVIDGEVQADHPHFGGRVVHRRNYTREPFSTPDPHATAVAGVVGAGGPGFVGVAPGVQIYNYKLLATQSALDGTDFEGGLALQHALEDGVDVVNCAWAAPKNGAGRAVRACNAGWQLGMTIVKSAGNRGPNPETVTSPAEAEGVIAVGATTADGRAVPDYSSRGPTADGHQRPHVVAPGGEKGAEIDAILPGGGTGAIQKPGTSFAAPHRHGRPPARARAGTYP
jgi:serine protease AprX